ncbi:MAG: GlsB/YeaQ/YmgE family stress response membrane protein [Chloroflexota bacterium]
MSWIAWIVVGAVAGFLASKIVGSKEGLVMMIVLGIVGALVGGYVAAEVLKIGSVDAINVESILIATLGAVGVLLIMRMVNGRRGLGGS